MGSIGGFQSLRRRGTGRLRHGNPPGDLRLAPRCGAKTRAGCPCRQPAMRNGRCRLHGGKSTGPRTAAGLARSQNARWRHGGCTAKFREMRKEGMRIRRNLRVLCALAEEGEIARREQRPPPTGYLRLLDATGRSPAELIAEVEANHRAAVRQGQATRRRLAAAQTENVGGHGLGRRNSESGLEGMAVAFECKEARCRRRRGRPQSL
jgi:hypothetical protein